MVRRLGGSRSWRRHRCISWVSFSKVMRGQMAASNVVAASWKQRQMETWRVAGTLGRHGFDISEGFLDE